MVETHDTTRRLIAITGDDAVHFLQGILTQDITKLTETPLQFAALLSPQGKILHDMFVIAGDAIGLPGTMVLDTPTLYADTLLKRLALYKLRAKVGIMPLDDGWTVAYTQTQGFADPRHPALPHRLYGRNVSGDISPTASQMLCLSLGIPDSARDFAPDEVVLLDAGYDLLNAVSFTKGCYVGQEITARMHYKNIARRGFYILESTEAPTQLALLKFEEVANANGQIMREGISYQARLPEWMQPKLHLPKA